MAKVTEAIVGILFCLAGSTKGSIPRLSALNRMRWSAIYNPEDSYYRQQMLTMSPLVVRQRSLLTTLTTNNRREGKNTTMVMTRHTVAVSYSKVLTTEDRLTKRILSVPKKCRPLIIGVVVELVADRVGAEVVPGGRKVTVAEVLVVAEGAAGVVVTMVAVDMVMVDNVVEAVAAVDVAGDTEVYKIIPR